MCLEGNTSHWLCLLRRMRASVRPWRCFYLLRCYCRPCVRLPFGAVTVQSVYNGKTAQVGLHFIRPHRELQTHKTHTQYNIYVLNIKWIQQLTEYREEEKKQPFVCICAVLCVNDGCECVGAWSLNKTMRCQMNIRNISRLSRWEKRSQR